MLIALDTSVLIALLDREDRWHPQAAALHEALVARAYDIVIFDCVLAETISTLARRLHEGRREGSLDVILDALQESYPLSAVEWLFPEVPALYPKVLALVRGSGGELNFNDALIALACEERTLGLLASFDRDFDTVSWITRVAQPGDLA